MYNHILVPLDGSELAERALPHALDLARCHGRRLSLVRIGLSQLYAYSPAGDGPLYSEDVLQADQQAAVEYLVRVKARLASADVDVTTEVLSGAVAETLIEYACDKGVDLIVMSTHGRSGLSRWVFGSVADKVLRGAHCPTLIVRGKLTADAR
jgi:nucleotide-binding universal stress UspA family protein